MGKYLFGVLLLFFSPVLASAADVMFEGYYRVELSGQHIGYIILRYEFEPKDKQFRQISFTRIKVGDKLMQESLRAASNDKLEPVSYQYTLQDDKALKTIDASFKGEIMTLKKQDDGKKVLTETHKIPKGTFFSSFLTYMMLQKPLPVSQAFNYSAVAEEEGASYSGKAMIDAKEVKPGYEILKIVNSFKGDKFVSRMAVVKDPKDPSKNIKGEVLSTSSPVKGITTELVVNPNQATENQMVPHKVLISLFGNMPTGKMHLLDTSSTAPAAAPVPETKKPAAKGN